MSDTSTRLPADTYLAQLRSDAGRMADLARGDGVLDLPVPTCPGWDVREVLVHTGRVYLHKLANIRTAARAEFPQRPGDVDVVAWFTDALDTLAAELSARGPAAPSYTWWRPEQDVGFWFRRMAQETAVHRVDVEAAVDAVGPVDAALAVDGVAEVLELFLTTFDERDRTLDTAEDEPGAIVSVRTGDHAWRVALDRDAVEVRAGVGPADAIVTGEPSELLLWLWGRRPDAAVSVTGEQDAIAALRRRLTAATQ